MPRAPRLLQDLTPLFTQMATLQFRSVADLNATIVQNLSRLPTDLDLVAGIPRSGMLPASLISLHLNLPLTDVDSLEAGHIYAHGETGGSPRGRAVRQANHLPRENPSLGSPSPTASPVPQPGRAGAGPRPAGSRLRVLVVDDSILSGSQMRQVRSRLSALSGKYSFLFAAIYGAPPVPNDVVDLVLELVPPPRIFEWNLMKHRLLEQTCTDLDGVLCVDPTPDENDDGPAYLHFVETARPYLLPSFTLGAIVTSRLEKYRRPTEDWLRRHDVRYRELIMVDLSDKPTRDRYHNHALFKAEVYKSKPWAKLFIESSAEQARQIAQIARKPVLSIEDRQLYHPPLPTRTASWLRLLPGNLYRLSKGWIRNRLSAHR